MAHASIEPTRDVAAHGGAHDAAHGEVAHHFADAQQQSQSDTLGMWLFLVTETMLFGGLFTVYAAYRWRYSAAVEEASHDMDVFWGTANTVLLIASSLTVALAHHFAQARRRALTLALLGATVVLGGGFLGIKMYEWVTHYEHHLLPGHNFHVEGAQPQHQELFFSLYFAMTGLHASHMVIGLLIALAMIVFMARGRLRHEARDVNVFGLYWHFVDIVWIFLFPLLYLIGRH